MAADPRREEMPVLRDQEGEPPIGMLPDGTLLEVSENYDDEEIEDAAK